MPWLVLLLCRECFLTDGLWMSYPCYSAPHSSGWRCCLRDPSDRGSLLASSTWSNSLDIGIYPSPSVRRHVLVSAIYKHNISIRQISITQLQMVRGKNSNWACVLAANAEATILVTCDLVRLFGDHASVNKIRFLDVDKHMACCEQYSIWLSNFWDVSMSYVFERHRGLETE